MKYFTVVARLENVSRAAELLNTTQSAVSKNIQNLEKELGTALFERNGRKIVLNDAGRRFLKSCDRILQETDSVTRELKQMQSGGDTVIRICAAGTEKRLAECMASFLHSYSNVEYRFNSFLPESEMPDINQVDVLIYPDEDRFRKYSGYDFYSEKYLLAAPKNSALSDRISLPTRMLNNQSFVFLCSKAEREYPFGVCTSQNIRMQAVHYTDTRQMHAEMIALGLGVGFVPESSAELYRQNSHIRLLHLADSRFSRQMKVCFKRDKHLSEAAAAFKDFMIEYYKLSER